MDIFINNAPAPAVPQVAQVQGMPYGYGPMPQHHHHGPPFFLVLLLVVGTVIFLKKWAGSGCGSRQGRKDMYKRFRERRNHFVESHAFEIARERYAKGEINAEEYETLKRNLTRQNDVADDDLKGGDLKI